MTLKKITSFDNIKSVENEVCEETDKKTQLIENHKRILISSLQSIKTHLERELDKVDSELTRAKTLLTNFKDSCDELLKTGSDVDICRENKSICRKTEELVNMKDLEDSLRKLGVINVTYYSSSATFEDTKSVLGDLKAGN